MTPLHAQVISLASWNADLCSTLSTPLLKGHTVAATDFRVRPGGKGSNAAVACARQGASTAVLSCIGQDNFGEMALDLWRREGILTEHVTRTNRHPSGVAQILIYPDGDNSIAVTPGANQLLSPELVKQAQACLMQARVVMATCEVPQAAISAAFSVAQDHGVTTLLNPAPALPLSDSLLAQCDVLTPNEHELRNLAQVQPDTPLAAAAAVMMARGVRALIVTQGAQGCTLFRPDSPATHISGVPIDSLVDTIGAGDTFTGTLAARLALGDSLPEALNWANAAAALSVRSAGAIDGMPGHADTRVALKRV